MIRFFNTTGPCQTRKHYMLPPERRLPSLMPFIEREQYFVLHAARQTGKTTAMMAFAERLRGLGYAAVMASLETSQGETKVGEAEARWWSAIRRAASRDLATSEQPPPIASFEEIPEGERLVSGLRTWAMALFPRRLVLLLDEADVVRGPALVSLLRQLRAGFVDRPEQFPSSVALIGMRDLKDYLTEAKDGVPVSPGSPFNIKAASLTLRDFSEAEIGELYAQHTADTGQRFEPDAVARAFYWSQGQPFLVNALAAIAVDELVVDRSRPVTADVMDAAKERLVLSRTTHLYSLAERLREPRVAAILDVVISGDEPRAIPYDSDDFQYVLDLGLLRKGPEGAEPANPIYREVLARQVTYNLQESLTRPKWPWSLPDGRLNFPALIDAFLLWWRQNAEALVEDVPLYPESIPHISLMAFLQRVVNGGGTIHREYAAGRLALDLVVQYGPDRFVVEVKRVRPRDSLETVREAAIEQTLAWLDRVGEREAWILIFDQRPGRSWEQRLWSETAEREGRRLSLRGG